MSRPECQALSDIADDALEAYYATESDLEDAYFDVHISELAFELCEELLEEGEPDLELCSEEWGDYVKALQALEEVYRRRAEAFDQAVNANVAWRECEDGHKWGPYNKWDRASEP